MLLNEGLSKRCQPLKTSQSEHTSSSSPNQSEDVPATLAKRPLTQPLQDLLSVGFLADWPQRFWKCRVATQPWGHRLWKPGSKLLVTHQPGLLYLAEVLKFLH